MPHIHEKIDFTVETFIVCNNKVLLRIHDKFGIWLSIGGHVELDEDPNQAAIREVKEEVGLDIKLFDTRTYDSKGEGYEALIPPISLSRHRVSPTHEHIAFIYFATSTSDKVVPEKATDVWKWCTKEEVDLLDGINQDVAYHAKRALDEVK